MPVLKEEFTFPSVVGDADIHAISWKPEGPAKAVLQLVHGMAEYIDRYDGMARWFAEHGIAVYGNDHLGLILQGAEHLELTVGLKAGQYS